MHPNSKRLYEHFYSTYVKNGGVEVLEVGAANINGSCREIFTSCKKYVGLDVMEFRGVDVVTKHPEKYPFEDESFDTVISTNTLEHCDRPWEVVKECARVLKKGGLMCHVVPWNIHVHKEHAISKDAWRVLPDGMNVLLNDAGLKILECRLHEDDTIGVAVK